MRNNYIIIGDSITYGIGDFENCGWATMFKKYIVNKDDSKECTNYVHIAGFPGARSNDILDKINHLNMKNLKTLYYFQYELMIPKNLMVLKEIVLRNIKKI